MAFDGRAKHRGRRPTSGSAVPAQRSRARADDTTSTRQVAHARTRSRIPEWLLLVIVAAIIVVVVVATMALSRVL
jgi:CHASE3 domain sensor protein